MGTPLKVLVGLGLVLPMMAYVVGSFAASSDDDPGRRDPVILRDAPESSTPPTPIRRPPAGQGRDRDGGAEGLDTRSEDSAAGRGEDDSDDSVDDNEVRVVTPKPTRLGDDDDDDDGQPEGDDDDYRDGGTDTVDGYDSDDAGGDD